MPPSPDASSRTAAPLRRISPALLAAAAVLLVLAWLGAQLWPQMAMAPSALPPSLAVEGNESSERRALTTDTPTELRLRSAGPEWKDLSDTQRQILQPLHLQWPAMGALTKRRWLLLAERYPQMSDKEQTKLHERMQSWASLSAQQRNQARLNFSNVKRLTPAELAAKWAEYQALSQAEKQRLEEQAQAAQKAAQAARKKRRLARVPAAASAPTAANPPKILPQQTPPAPAHLPEQGAVAAPVKLPAAAPAQPLPPITEAAPQPVQVPQQMYIMDLPPLPQAGSAPHTKTPAAPAPNPPPHPGAEPHGAPPVLETAPPQSLPPAAAPLPEPTSQAPAAPWIDHGTTHHPGAALQEAPQAAASTSLTEAADAATNAASAIVVPTTP